MATTTNLLGDLIKRVPALGLIGNTPLLEINVLHDEFPGLSLRAKAEWMNPGGSIKDRPVLNMLARALAEDAIGGRRVLDSTSGNSGIAYAMIGAALKLPITLVIPGNASKERLRRIKAHGAEVILTDPILGYDEVMRHCHKLAHEHEDKYFLIDQYSNRANWEAHYHGTAEEILRQGGGDATHFISGVGTGGTLTGIAKRLKEHNPKLTVAVMLPEEFPGIEGLKPLKNPTDIRPRNFHESLVDLRIDVTIEEAFEHSKLLAQNGIFVGQSAGANVAAARKIAQSNPRARIVTLMPDTGERYYSTGLWD